MYAGRLIQVSADHAPVPGTNAAYDHLLADYARFHTVLVVVGGVFMLARLGLAVYAFARSRRAPRASFEKRMQVLLGLLSLTIGALLALVVAANLSNVLNPARGLAGTVGEMRYSRAYDAWLRSGAAEIPAFIQQRVDERLAWQAPKAVICAVLLVGVVWLSAYLWRRLLRSDGRGRIGLMLGSAVAGFASFLLMLMVMGNTQAAFAPVVMTLLYG